MQKSMSSHFIHKMKMSDYSPKVKELVEPGVISKWFNRNKTKKVKQTYKVDAQYKKEYDNFFLAKSYFYEETAASSDLSKYFFPGGKRELVIKGAGVAGDPDIYAEWLGIPSSGAITAELDHRFESKVTIAPYMKRVGTNVYVHKVLHDNFWFSVFAPIVEVSTNMNLKEFDIVNARGIHSRPQDGAGNASHLYFEEPLNATQAFVHPLMKYGKIDNKTHRLAGVADVAVKLGYTKKHKTSLTWSPYIGFVIPTGYKPTAEYLFEPLVGNCQHFAVNAGFDFVWKLTGSLSFLSAIDYQYLFESNQKRSMDLKDNGPWSRYMAATLNLPRNRPERLINYLTKDVEVTPRSHFNGLAALRFNHAKFNFEIGADLEWRDSEKIRLYQGMEDMVGIAFYSYDNTSGLIQAGPLNDIYGRTYHEAKINEPMIIDLATADPAFVAITPDDLDLNSARHPSFVSAKVFASAGFDGHINNIPFLFSIGGSYTFGDSNKSLDSWGVWGQINLSV